MKCKRRPTLKGVARIKRETLRTHRARHLLHRLLPEKQTWQNQCYQTRPLLPIKRAKCAICKQIWQVRGGKANPSSRSSHPGLSKGAGHDAAVRPSYTHRQQLQGPTGAQTRSRSVLPSHTLHKPCSVPSPGTQDAGQDENSVWCICCFIF